MATWNYRVLEDEHGMLALHEVFYDSAGNPNSYTENPVSFIADADEGIEGIIGSLEKALDDAKKRPVLKLSDFSFEKN